MHAETGDVLAYPFLVGVLPFGPHNFVLVGVRFDLGSIGKVCFQLHILRFYQVGEHFAKDGASHFLHPHSPKIVDRAKVRILLSAQSHEMDVLPQCRRDLA